MTQEEQQIIDILITAIKGGNLIRFEYNGQIRIVEPYLIGELYCKFQNHLEEGKFADIIVLNKNYFDANAVPDPMIKTVRPLLTMIGGHLRYIDTEFATEQNTKPAGIQPEQVIKQIREWEAGGTGDKADAGREL